MSDVTRRKNQPLSSRAFAATCRRDGSAWLVELTDSGGTARASRLSQVEEVARGLAAGSSGQLPADVTVVIDLVLDDEAHELFSAAAHCRAFSELVTVEEVSLRRRVALGLARKGFTERDIAFLLGVSYRRVQQLVAEPGAASRARRPLERPTEPVRSPRAPARAHTGYRHEAFFYRGVEEFLAGTVQFVREGLHLGQPVLVAVVTERLQRLRQALGDDADAVLLVDMALLGHNPGRIIPRLLEFLTDHSGPGRPVRGVGEPVWAGRRAAEVVECQLHEALLNVAIDPDTPLWLRCAYDLAALDPSLPAEALRSHPAVSDVHGYRGSTSYGGASHALERLADPLPEPAVAPLELDFDAGSLARVRRTVLERATSAGVDSEARAELAVVAAELAGNSVRHGGGAGSLRVWQDSDAFAFEVSDGGRLDDPLVGRRTPGADLLQGRGLWLANQLADLVQIRTAPSGTRVRVLTWT